MTSSLIFLFVSFLLLVAFLFLKHLELSSGKTIVALEIRSKSDTFLHGKILAVKRFLGFFNYKTAMIVVHALLSYIARILHFVQNKITEKRQILSLELKKHTVLQKKEKRSSFLSTIGEYKEKAGARQL